MGPARAQQAGRTSAFAVVILTGMLAVASCSSTTSDDGTTSPGPTPSVDCTPGAADQPTEISRLTLDGVTAETFTTTLTVPFDGLAGGPLDRPSVVRAAVVTAESGAPVTFRTDTGGVIADRTADWLSAGREITVTSTQDESGCSAAVYLFSTRTGSLTLEVESDGGLSTTLDVVTATAAARNLSVDVMDTEVTSGADIDVTVTATDAFGNPVEGSTIAISVPQEAPARYLNGSNRATVLTDDEGRTEVRLLTESDRTRIFNVRVRAVKPRCTGVNQYGCGIDEPFIGAGEPVADIRVPVTVLQPPADDPVEEEVSPRSARR